MRMIWGVRALNTMARHAHSSAAAKCPQQGRRYFPMRDSFSRRDNFRVVSMKAKTLPLSFFSLFQIPGTKKAPSFRGRRHSRKGARPIFWQARYRCTMVPDTIMTVLFFMLGTTFLFRWLQYTREDGICQGKQSAL